MRTIPPGISLGLCLLTVVAASFGQDLGRNPPSGSVAPQDSQKMDRPSTPMLRSIRVLKKGTPYVLPVILAYQHTWSTPGEAKPVLVQFARTRLEKEGPSRTEAIWRTALTDESTLDIVPIVRFEEELGHPIRIVSRDGCPRLENVTSDVAAAGTPLQQNGRTVHQSLYIADMFDPRSQKLENGFDLFKRKDGRTGRYYLRPKTGASDPSLADTVYGFSDYLTATKLGQESPDPISQYRPSTGWRVVELSWKVLPDEPSMDKDREMGMYYMKGSSLVILDDHIAPLLAVDLDRFRDVVDKTDELGKKVQTLLDKLHGGETAPGPSVIDEVKAIAGRENGDVREALRKLIGRLEERERTAARLTSVAREWENVRLLRDVLNQKEFLLYRAFVGRASGGPATVPALIPREQSPSRFLRLLSVSLDTREAEAHQLSDEASFAWFEVRDEFDRRLKSEGTPTRYRIANELQRSYFQPESLKGKGEVPKPEPTVWGGAEVWNPPPGFSAYSLSRRRVGKHVYPTSIISTTDDSTFVLVDPPGQDQRPFYMQKYEVTVARWQKFLAQVDEKTPKHARWLEPRNGAEGELWKAILETDDAKGYDALTDQKKRLARYHIWTAIRASDKYEGHKDAQDAQKFKEWVDAIVPQCQQSVLVAVSQLAVIPEDQPVRGIAPGDVNHYASWVYGRAINGDEVALPTKAECDLAAPTARGQEGGKVENLPPGHWGQSQPLPPTDLEAEGKDQSWCGVIGLRGNVRECVLTGGTENGKRTFSTYGLAWRDLEETAAVASTRDEGMTPAQGDWETGFRLVLHPGIPR